MVRAAMSAAARTLGPRSESDLILPFDSLLSISKATSLGFSMIESRTHRYFSQPNAIRIHPAGPILTSPYFKRVKTPRLTD